MNRAYYSGSIADFLNENSDAIYGKIAGSNLNDKLVNEQSEAWKAQIRVLKTAVASFDGRIYFEFTIPRMGKRVDNIIIIDGCIFVLEFKIGSKTYEKYAKDQAFDYGLDLNNFHEGSHKKYIFPILVSDKAPSSDAVYINRFEGLHETVCANAITLSKIIQEGLDYSKSQQKIDIDLWEQSRYKPTPTIIEAATALYRNHKVEDITRHEAGADNLSKTSKCISSLIDFSKKNSRKTICFITGVPGAGKTLAGLDITNQRSNFIEEEHAVFLSGNGPLVDVLREALIRDKVKTAKNEKDKSVTKKSVTNNVKSFIQNIHHFRNNYWVDKAAPSEKVTVFDEAQRAWTKHQASKFMKKKGNPNFNQSEPEFLIEVMDRHVDWCTVVCLIGGGQEINTGEAGLEEWIRPFKNKFSGWDIYCSAQIFNDQNYIRDRKVIEILENRNATKNEALHLNVCLRSYRSEHLSDFIQKVISNNIEAAKNIYVKSIKESYPIVITRDLSKARDWLKEKAIGNHRTGIVASSGGIRLKPFGLNVKAKIDAPIWFLNPKEDIRSSFFLEEVATEFDVQGLELDWTCVAWDGDLFYQDNKWNYRKFKGAKWQFIQNDQIVNYLINSYRVLLTRARQGIVIYIPYGDNEDLTRPSFMYDGTFHFFKSIGIEEL